MTSPIETSRKSRLAARHPHHQAAAQLDPDNAFGPAGAHGRRLYIAVHRNRHEGRQRVVGQPFHSLYRRRQKPLPRLAPPVRELMRRNFMPPRHIHYPRARLKGLRHDPRFTMLNNPRGARWPPPLPNPVNVGDTTS